jgi:hypothetical protein
MQQLECSIECPVSRSFAWRFWTNVANWAKVDPAVEAAELDGPFAAGTKGLTKQRGSAPVEWRLVQVQDGERAVIEIPVPGAVAQIQMLFEEHPGGVRVTQRMAIAGERAADYAEFMTVMKSNLPEGMRRLAEAMSRAASGQA